MAKRRSLQPWPETVWHTSGRLKNSRALQVIRQRLQQEPFHHWREFTPADADEARWYWGFDAAWRTEDGDRIKARLEMQPDTTAMRHLGLDKAALEAHEINIEMAWRLTAEADCPWNLEWPSPVAMFGDTHLSDYISGRVPLVDGYSYSTNHDPKLLAKMFREMAGAPWYIFVITHDKRPIDTLDPAQEPKLVHFLPPSLHGRVLEMRVFGGQDQLVNAEAVLPDSKLRLKWGGALILPTSPRQEDWAWADYSVRRPSGGDMVQLLKETAAHLTRYATLLPHFDSVVRWGVHDLRENWVLPEIETAPKRVLEEREAALARASELEVVLAETRDLLRSEREAAEVVRKAKDALGRELQEMRTNPLAQQAREAVEQAKEAWRSARASDSEVERLTGEVAYLRRIVAQIPGRSYDEPVPEPAKGPESWQEMLELVPELLEHVTVLESVRAPLQKLFGHSSAANWLRRTWETLEALNAYVVAKKEHGPQVLPNFATYLEWPQATDLIPRTWYRPSEVSLERRSPNLKSTRMFEVPGLGEVFMGPHVRIGQGSGGLAPRLHFYDDTCGPTLKIHVGYIGPHLPNWQGR